MTVWKPQSAPYYELHTGLLMLSSGQKTVYTGFNKVKAAIPHVNNNGSKHIVPQFNGFSVNYSGGAVDVFANGSGNDDSASGVLPNTSIKFHLEVYGIK